METEKDLQSKTRWGILGTGKIAYAFAHGLAYVEDADLVAVGSRRQETADSFADRFKIPRRHGSYEALADDPNVDIIYVSSPHSEHCRDTLLCLDHGKAVLCEKPFAINAAESERMIARAQENGLFLMEAMWMRFLPVMEQVRKWLQAGEIGSIEMVAADFGFQAEFDPQWRLFNPELGGGALLDVGIYPVSFAFMVMGQAPVALQTQAIIGTTGVDELTSMLFRYDSDKQALLSCSNRCEMSHSAYIYGDQGQIYVHPAFWRGQRATLKKQNRSITLDLPFHGNGYYHEAKHVQACLQKGETTSPLMPLDETLVIMRTLDAIRDQIGLIYPMER
ncbi:Gfo/Idh/MocA family oxidoreductase [candidate division KSB1 bacterium]|nr:Gfo/Idh/MocA family oxidoreductase [candidate division KSB1 bacterium]